MIFLYFLPRHSSDRNYFFSMSALTSFSLSLFFSMLAAVLPSSQWYRSTLTTIIQLRLSRRLTTSRCPPMRWDNTRARSRPSISHANERDRCNVDAHTRLGSGMYVVRRVPGLFFFFIKYYDSITFKTKTIFSHKA